MGTIYGRKDFGYFRNGTFENGTNEAFTFGTINSTDARRGEYCLQRIGGGGATFIGPDFIPVDTTRTYQMIAWARTLQRGSQNNSLAGGHIGFACYDEFFNFIALTNCGDIGNTTLSRDLVAGDSFAYITSKTGWYENAANSNSFNMFGVYPATHPLYATPYRYTRLTEYRYNATSISLMAEGDFRLTLATTFPNIGYATPAGTPIMNAQSGGTYNYALGAPNYPETWTRYATAPFTGENRNSVTPFRYATKYIKFLILQNRNRRTETPQDHIWALDDIFWGISEGGKDYRNILP